jgi:hypothetical protein
MSEYVLSLASALIALNNLYSACAVAAAISQSPIHRLKRLWEGKEVDRGGEIEGGGADGNAVEIVRYDSNYAFC